jgi:ABC-2 type transport system permease protein
MSDLFPNALHVARREYLFRVRGRAFRITTILLALAVILFTMVPTFLSVLGLDDPPEIAVHVAADDLSSDPVVAIQAVLLAGSDPEAVLDGEPPSDDGGDRAEVTRTDDPEAARQEVRDGDLDGLLLITRGESGDLAFEYVSGSSSPTNRTSLLVSQAASALTISDRLERAGVSAGESAEIFAAADFTTTPANPQDARNEEDFGGAYMLAYAVVILTFMAILTYGQWVAQSVAEEKSGRVMELLITAATPRQLLTGKVLGTGAAGLTQYAVVIGAVVIGFLANGPVSEMLGVAGTPIQLPELDPLFVLWFGAFFLLGFVLYATLYAAAGSMVSRIEDVQQAAGPLIFVAMAGYFASFAALNDPDAGWVGAISLVPFFSPYLVPARMLLTNPSLGEVTLALAILAATVVVAIWIASRIYSAGVLMYGQRVGWRTILRATRVAR